MLDLRIVNLPGQRVPFPQSKGRKRRLVATVQPKVRTQHGNNRTVIAHQFARVHHESPAVAFAKAKGNTGPDSAVAFRSAPRLAELFLTYLPCIRFRFPATNSVYHATL